MDVKNLMIGDWVRISHLNKVGQVYRIDRANGKGNGFVAVIDGDYDESSIEPIPLTEEILEKNGFKGEGYAVLDIDKFSWLEYYYYERRLRKKWRGVDEWQNHAHVTDITFQCHCSYVHELQHALRLCGIEKEITL